MYMIIRKMIKRLPAYLIMTILLALGMVNVRSDEVKAAEMKSSNEIVKDKLEKLWLQIANHFINLLKILLNLFS